MEETYLRNLEATAIKANSLSQKSLVFYDIGARDGLKSSWDHLARIGLVKAYGFDPAKEHIDSLSTRDSHITYIPYALGDKNEQRTLIKTFMPGCSSFLEPNMELLKNYPCHKIFEIIGQEDGIKVMTINDLIEDDLVPRPHFLKIDTQGFEMQVLKGANKVLDQVLGIELETQFKPMYKNQSLFPEIKEFLENHGFILRSLEVNGPYEGEFLEADAFFSKRPRLNDDLILIRLWQEACMLKSPKFLAQMYEWLPEWKCYLTDEQTKLRDLLFGNLS